PVMNLSIIGGGSWGTGLAIVLAPRFERISLWVYEAELADRMCERRENDVYLPGLKLPSNVDVTTSFKGAEIVLGVMPSRPDRRIYTEARPHFPESTIFVSATKGIEQGSLMRMSEVLTDVIPFARTAVLSGPTFAREIARGEPAAVVIASTDPAIAGQ